MAETELIQGILDSEIHDLSMMSLYNSFRIYDTKKIGEIIEKRKQIPQRISRKLFDKTNERIKGNMALSLLLTCGHSNIPSQVYVP